MTSYHPLPYFTSYSFKCKSSNGNGIMLCACDDSSMLRYFPSPITKMWRERVAFFRAVKLTIGVLGIQLSCESL
jgi:hypothetical protein